MFVIYWSIFDFQIIYFYFCKKEREVFLLLNIYVFFFIIYLIFFVYIHMKLNVIHCIKLKIYGEYIEIYYFDKISILFFK
jgi:hypothetical protein